MAFTFLPPAVREQGVYEFEGREGDLRAMFQLPFPTLARIEATAAFATPDHIDAALRRHWPLIKKAAERRFRDKPIPNGTYVLVPDDFPSP